MQPQALSNFLLLKNWLLKEESRFGLQSNLSPTWYNSSSPWGPRL